MSTCRKPLHKACRCVRPAGHEGECNCAFPEGFQYPKEQQVKDYGYGLERETARLERRVEELQKDYDALSAGWADDALSAGWAATSESELTRRRRMDADGLVVVAAKALLGAATAEAFCAAIPQLRAALDASDKAWDVPPDRGASGNA